MSNLQFVPMTCGVTYSSWVELRVSVPAASLRDDVTVETVTSIDTITCSGLQNGGELQNSNL